MIKITLVLLCLVVGSVAFAPVRLSTSFRKQAASTTRVFSDQGNQDIAFIPEAEAAGDDELVNTIETRRASQKKRGRRKSGALSQEEEARKAAVTLAPEEVYYEGPPAITETVVPTISVLTVIGIVPAAAAWARQAWVRYKITTRRIRVTSGIGGKDMAEIVYPDVVELRTARRLFGDGDMVFFLRDGARFEVRNVPDFEKALEFILAQLDPKVVAVYKNKGDVTEAPQ